MTAITVSSLTQDGRSGRVEGGGGGGGVRKGGGGKKGAVLGPPCTPSSTESDCVNNAAWGHRHPSAESPPAWLISIPRPEISDTNISAHSSEQGSSVSTPLPGNNLPILLPRCVERLSHTRQRKTRSLIPKNHQVAWWLFS